MGGTGGGIANNETELKEITANGLKYSPVNQCLIEKSIAGFKEIEYEVQCVMQMTMLLWFVIWKT